MWAIEALMRLSGEVSKPFHPATPDHLQFARTCYDHAAGEFAVGLYDWLLKSKWIVPVDDGYEARETLSSWG